MKMKEEIMERKIGFGQALKLYWKTMLTLLVGHVEVNIGLWYCGILSSCHLQL